MSRSTSRFASGSIPRHCRLRTLPSVIEQSSQVVTDFVPFPAPQWAGLGRRALCVWFSSDGREKAYVGRTPHANMGPTPYGRTVRISVEHHSLTPHVPLPKGKALLVQL